MQKDSPWVKRRRRKRQSIDSIQATPPKTAVGRLNKDEKDF
jgi:hypothetical protein